MQRNRFQVASAGLALFGLAATAFAHGDGDGLETRLKGYSEVPALSSAASGRFRASIDERSGSISYNLSYKGLEGEVRQAHIHLGQRGVNGGIMVWLCQTPTNVDPTGQSPTCPQSGNVSGVLQAANVIGPSAQGIAPLEFAELVSAIRAGVAYVNIHSSKFPTGEVRGQLQDDDRFGGW